MSELKSCPFCGEVPTPDMIQADPTQGSKWGGVVCCIRGPEVRTCYDPVECWREEAIAAWNTRPAPTEAEVEAAARRAAGASWLVDGPNLNRSWDMAPEAVREHFRRVARAALGVGP